MSAPTIIVPSSFRRASQRVLDGFDPADPRRMANNYINTYLLLGSRGTIPRGFFEHRERHGERLELAASQGCEAFLAATLEVAAIEMH